jgi:hypothetical protein
MFLKSNIHRKVNKNHGQDISQRKYQMGRNVFCVQVLTNGPGKHEYSGGTLIVKLGSVLNGVFVLSTHAHAYFQCFNGIWQIEWKCIDNSQVT